MATVISIASQKGGTGKSSTAINLACGLEVEGYRMAVVDTDPQATFSMWNMKRERKGKATFKVHPTPVGLIETTVESLRADTTIDIILIDCPGNSAEITSTGVKYSDAVISPVRPSTIDLAHSKGTSEFIKVMRQHYPDMQFLLFLNAAMPAWNISKQMTKALQDLLGNMERAVVMKTHIPNVVAIAEFFATGLSIFEYAPKSPAAAHYTALTKEVIKCLASA